MDALRQQGEPVLLVDAGDVVGARGSQIPNEAVLAALAAGGYAALNVGEEEAAWGLEPLRKAAEEAKLPLVSSNLFERDTGRPAFATELSLDVQGVRVALLGVIGPDWEKRYRSAKADEFVTLDPAAALAERVPRLRADHDLVVLLAQLTQAQARDLAAQVPGIDVIVGGEERTVNPFVGPLDGTFWVQSKPYGRGMVMARLEVGQTGMKVVESKEVPVAEEAPANAKVEQLIAEAGKTTGRPVSPLALGYRGAQWCKRCHSEQFMSWSVSDHARALDTLKKEKRAGEAACLGCHTTNAPETPPTVALPGVQCEVCHGPFARHELRYVKGHGKAAQTDWKTICLRCHDPANSPKFDLPVYLSRVRHTAPPPPPAEGSPTATPPQSAPPE